MKENICTAAGVIGGFFAALLGGWDSALITLVLFMAIDFTTGLIAASMIQVEDAHPAIIDKETFLRVQEIMQEHQRFAAKIPTTGVYPFSGMIKCGCCGKSYRRKTTVTGIVWICNTYNKKGKRFCPTAKQIPEEKLIAACCEVLNTASFDEEVFHSKVEQIIIPKPNNIRFLFSDGLERTVTWQDRSRSESWTPEMRARTGQQTRERSKKCRK